MVNSFSRSSVLSGATGFAQPVDLAVYEFVDLRVYELVVFFQEMPGFAVFLIQAAKGHFPALRIKEDQSSMSKLLDRNEVPDVERSDERSQNVDLIAGVATAALGRTPADDHLKSEPAFPMRRKEGGLHLNAKQATVVLNEKIVRMTVSVRFCDGDAFAGGAIHESQLGELTTDFVVLKRIAAMLCQGFVPEKRMVGKKKKARRESAPFLVSIFRVANWKANRATI